MMRPGQNKQRMRGRHRGGGKGGGGGGGNPLQRSYESNGPDVKLRGTAQHIAEKYAQLARDAQSTDDYVLAENYLQHAEHYSRMIAAYQLQFAAQNGGLQRNEEGDGDESEGGDEGLATEGGDFNGRQNYRDNRDNRFQRNNYQRHDRHDNAEQPSVSFPQRDENQPVAREEGEHQPRGPRRFDKRNERPQRNHQPRNENENTGAPVAPASEGGEQLPSFLTRTRRRVRAQEETSEDVANNNTATPPASEA
ncbi:MAG: DUF4167 domain-containing protein [Pseudomonadota bacterium]